MEKIMLEIKPFQETLNCGFCGPASLKILLSYYGIDKNEKELAEMAGWDKELGVDDKGIKNASEQLGFKVEIKNDSSFEDHLDIISLSIGDILQTSANSLFSMAADNAVDGGVIVVIGEWWQSR